MGNELKSNGRVEAVPIEWVEEERRRMFPVVGDGIFLAHAGVTVLPAAVAEAMIGYTRESCSRHQEFGGVLKVVQQTREVGAELIGASGDEVALLGPTSLGLSLFANGIDWKPGDEVVCYRDDYPANVYPWMALERHGVVIRWVETPVPGQITAESVAAAIGPRTRLVALASCHYLTGWRIDTGEIGSLLRGRGILFSLDAIQTLGAFPTSVEDVDFLSADAHKWMLGPLAIGLVYVARRNFPVCRPTLLGAWNVKSPEFLTADEIEFEDSARRYEPGVLNTSGIYGMKASLEMLRTAGIGRVSASILAVRDTLEELLEPMGFQFLSPRKNEPLRSGILTVAHPAIDSSDLFAALEHAGITCSMRKDRPGKNWLRFSPHYYNTPEEMQQVAAVLRAALAR